MAWVYLLVAGLFEVAWAIGLKYSDGLTRLWPSVYTLVTMALSIIFLAWAVRSLPIGTAYAIWTGIGAAGTAILGIILFHESMIVGRLLSIALIILGIILLKLSSPA